MNDVVGLLHYPWGEDYGVGDARRRTPRRLYRSTVAYKANPRTPEYMAALLAERHPGAALVRTDRDDWRERVASAGRLVVLYPDSTGLGFAPLERELLRTPGGQAWGLNGRRREFELDRQTRRRLLLRRALERSLVLEAAALAALALATPFLLVYDLARGRR